MREKIEQLVEQLRSAVTDLRNAMGVPGTDAVQQKVRAVRQSIRQLNDQGIAIPQQLHDMEASLSKELAGWQEAAECARSLLKAVREARGNLRPLVRQQRTERSNDSSRITRRRIRPAEIAPGQITWTVPTAYRLFNEPEQRVRSWRDVLVGVVERLLRGPAEHAELLMQFRSKRGRVYFSKNQHELRDPLKLSNGYFLEANLTAKGVLQCVHAMLELCGYQREDLSVQSEARQNGNP